MAEYVRKPHFIYVTGKCKWARMKSPDPRFHKYSITLWPENLSELSKVQELKSKGIRNDLKKDDDGYYMTFSRPSTIKLRTGLTKVIAPPLMVNKDGELFEDNIGDGSDVTVKLETYGGESGQGKYYAARLESVRINHLVPYIPAKNEQEDTLLNKRPEPLF